MKPAEIELRVGELVLHGFEPKDRHRIGLAMENELGRLLAERGAPRSLDQGREIPQLTGGSFEVAPGAGAGSIGVQVAQAVYGGLGA